MKNKRDIVQIKNPRSGRYIKIDRTVGRIIGHSFKKYKGIRLINRKKEEKITE